MTDASDQHLVEVWVRTHHPEHYHLVNLHDWTVWKIVDGHWEEVGEQPKDPLKLPPRASRRSRRTR